MTKSQEKAVAKIKALAEKEANTIHEEGEIKKWEVNEHEYFVAVFVELGGKNDEGTMGEIFAREAAHLFIGKRGGITYPVHKKLKNGEWKHYEKRFIGYSLLQAVVDQQ